MKPLEPANSILRFWALLSVMPVCLLVSLFIAAGPALSEESPAKNGEPIRLARRWGPVGIIPIPPIGVPSGSRHHKKHDSKIPDIPMEQVYGDDSDEQKPKPKRAVAAPKDLHPENDGSRQARAFLLKVAINSGPGLAEFVWKGPQAAEKLFVGALKDFANIPYPEGRRAAHKDLGDVYFLKGMFSSAVDNYQKALELNTKIGDGENHAIIVNSMGAALWASGEYDSASGYYDDALKTFNDIGATDGEGNVRNNMGVLFETQGKWDSAAEQFQKAMAVDKTNLKLRVLASANLGEIYKKQGKYDEAELAFKESYEASKKIKNLKLQAHMLVNLGELHREWASVRGTTSKLSDAGRELMEAYHLCQQSGVPVYFPGKLLGDLYLDTGDTLRAEPYLKEAQFNSSLARMYLMRNDMKKAAERYEKLLNSARNHNRYEDLMVASIGLGKTFEASKNYARAEEHYSNAMDAAERVREARLLSERRGFFAVPIDGFAPSEAAKGLTRVRIKKLADGKKKPDQSIYPLELTRAREFSDNLALNARVEYGSVPKELQDREKRLMGRIASLSMARDLLTRDQDREAYDKKTKEINDAENSLYEFVDNVWKRHQAYAAARHPKAIELADCAIAPDEYVVIFDVAGDSLSVKLIKGKEVLKARCVDWNSAELARSVGEFRRPFEGHEGTVDGSRLELFNPKLAQELYRGLFADMLQSVPQGSPLTIIPDDVLGKLPFEALVVGGQVSWKKESGASYPEGLEYLGDLYSVSYYQSLTALTLVRAFPKSGIRGDRLLVMVDPAFEGEQGREEEPSESNSSADKPPEPPKAAAATEEENGADSNNDVVSFRSLDEPELTLAPTKSIRRKARLETRQSTTTDTQATPVREKASPQKDASTSQKEFSWPRLKLTAQLGDALRRIHPDRTDLFRGPGARKSILTSKPLHRYRSILFGTHGYFGLDLPGIMEPVLVFSPDPQGGDSFLRMTEVMGLDISADLVTLTACQTGLGDFQSGEGIISMGRAFQFAGARSVVMTLWTVPEAASVSLMDSFARHLQQGDNKAVALRLAREDLRKQQSRYNHPFFWAPFILVGESWPVPNNTRIEAAEKLMKASYKRPKPIVTREPRRQSSETEDE